MRYEELIKKIMVDSNINYEDAEKFLMEQIRRAI